MNEANERVVALACATVGQAHAAARKVYLRTRYVCRMSTLNSGETVVTIPGVQTDEVESIFKNLFNADINIGLCRVTFGKYTATVSVSALPAV